MEQKLSLESECGKHRNDGIAPSMSKAISSGTVFVPCLSDNGYNSFSPDPTPCRCSLATTSDSFLYDAW